MSNVSNPAGPVNPVNPQKSNEPAKPGTEKFRELMKIDSSAEKQKKRKKRSDEAHEEQKAKISVGPAATEKLVEAKKTQKYPKIQKVGEGEKKQTKHQKRSEETATEIAREEAAALTQKKPVQPLEVPDETKKAEEDVKTAVKQATVSSQIHKELEQIIDEEEQAVQKEQKKEEFKKIITSKEETKKETVKPSSVPSPSTLLGPLFLAPATAAPPAYSLLDSQTWALFEKMVSVISILKDSGVTETTLHLNTPEFANSQYYGAQIIIREYSTAPLTYNIELIGNPLAAELFRKNLTTLRSAFDDPKYRFRIHRLDASIKRVESKKDKESA